MISIVLPMLTAMEQFGLFFTICNFPHLEIADTHQISLKEARTEAGQYKKGDIPRIVATEGSRGAIYPQNERVCFIQHSLHVSSLG